MIAAIAGDIIGFGRQVRRRSTHWCGKASAPKTAPGSAPAMAALVSVSPPQAMVCAMPFRLISNA